MLGVGYMLTGLGVTVGFHRLFTHRSFKTRMPIRVLLAALGSAAVEGPLIEWVSNHRMHHRFSDRIGDPHSPHVDQDEGHEHGSGWRGAVRGLLHAHVGWLLRRDHRASPERYAPDLLADPVMRWMDRLFPLLVLLGLAAAVRRRRGVDRHRRRRPAGAALGRRGQDHDPSPRDLLGELALPLLRPPPVRNRRRVAQPRLARRCPPSARPGTTTTTLSRPRPATGWGAASSISPAR